MKKLILSLFIGISILPIYSEPILSTSPIISEIVSTKVDYTQFPKKDVYLIKQVDGNKWSSAKKIGYYDADSNRMWIGGVDYNIHENRAYGQANDGRSEYQYEAGGYYFNL